MNAQVFSCCITAAVLASAIAKGGAATRSVVIEKELPQPPEKIWRVLTEVPLIKQWLMDNDFQPVVGHRFNFRDQPRPGWDGLVKSEVMIVEPGKKLSYSWNASAEEAAKGQGSAVTWTLIATKGGTLVHMELSGLSTDQEANYQGAKYAFQRFFAGMERVAAGLE